MSADRAIGALTIALMLVLPVSALVARRLPAARMARLVIMWVILFATAGAVVALLGLNG